MKNFLATLVISAFISISAFAQIEIDNAKNVGIGIATPTHKMDVNGQLRIRTIPINNALNEILVRDANGVVHHRGLETFSFWTKSGDSLFSDPACFVGIGTSSPIEPLHVEGALRVSDHHGHVTILKTPVSGGMTVESKDELRLNTFDSLSVHSTSVRINPPDTTSQTSFDSFFDIITDAGECRYRAGIIDTGGLSGTGILLSDRHQLSGVSDGGGGGGRVLIRPDISQTRGGGSLTVSNLGSSGLDGVRIRLDADTTSGSISYRGFDPDPDNNCAVVFTPSTLPGTGRLAVSNLGSSGLDGVRVSLGNARLDSDHSLDPGGSGGGGRVIITPDKRIVDGGTLRVSNLGSSGCDGVSIDLGEDVRIEGRDDLLAQGGGGGGGRIAFIFDDASTDQRMVVSNIGSSGSDGVGFSDDAGQFWFENLEPGVHNPQGGALRLTPGKLPSATGNDHLVISNIGSSGDDGVRIGMPHQGRIFVDNCIAPDPRSTTVIVSPLDTGQTPAASFDSFFDIFVDAGECRWRGTDNSSDTTEGTGLLLHEKHLLSGSKTTGGGGAGGSIFLHPDVTQQNGGSRLKVSNLGSSGCDGVSVDLGEDARIEGKNEIAGGGGTGGSIALKPSTTPGHKYIDMLTLGTTGQDGIRLSLSEDNPVPVEILSMDLVSSDPVGILGPRLRMNTDIGSLSVGNTGSASLSGISLMDESVGNTGGHVNFLPNSVCLFPGNGMYSSVMARNDGTGSALGVRLTLDQNSTGLEPAVDLNQDGSLDLVVRRAGGNNGQLTVSNIGSSGEDGVRMALSSGTATTIPTEIVALQLESSGPAEVVRLDNNVFEWVWSFESTDQRLTRTVRDNTPGTTAAPHVYEYDGNNNIVRESGPPSREYESGDLTTLYEYDLLDRRVVRVTADLNPSSTGTPYVHTYDANNNLVRESGPPTTEYESDSLRTRCFYDSALRITTERREDLTNPGLPPIVTEYDFGINRMFVNATFSAAAKNFTIDHPLDPYNKNLRHVSVESPDMMNIYNGNVTTDEKGYAIVTMPDYFTALNMEFRYQLTAMGVFAQAIVKEKLADNQFVIQTDKPNVEVSWQVTGIRNDTYAKENRVLVEVDKEEAMKGKLLYEPKNNLGLK